MYQKLWPKCPVKIKARMKWQTIALLCKQTRPITSGPNLHHSAIYQHFPYHLSLIKIDDIYGYGDTSSYPRSPSWCSEAVVDWFGITRIFIQGQCLNAPLSDCMNQRCKEPACFFQTPISPPDSASHWSFAYYNGIVGNTSVADGASILHIIT